MNDITLKNRQCCDSMSLLVFSIIVLMFFSSSIAYGEDIINQFIDSFSNKNKQDNEQPIDFLLIKTNERFKDANNKIDLSLNIKERLINEFPNKLNDKKRIEAEIKKNLWCYFFCSDEKRNDFLNTFKRNFQLKKEIIEFRQTIYKDFETVKYFVEDIKAINTESNGRGILISEVFWLKDAFDIPKKFAGINEISITKEKYEPWSRNIPFFFDIDLEILEQTNKTKKKIQKILNERITKRLEKVEELEKIMTDEFPETTDSFTTLKNILEKTSMLQQYLKSQLERIDRNDR